MYNHFSKILSPLALSAEIVRTDSKIPIWYQHSFHAIELTDEGRGEGKGTFYGTDNDIIKTILFSLTRH
jgi:hypothetical protein